MSKTVSDARSDLYTYDVDAALLGTWSSEVLYESGPADQSLSFREDQTGRYDITNWTLCEVIYFSWRAEQQLISIEGLLHVQLDESRKVLDRRPCPDLLLKDVPYRITTEDGRLPNSGPIEVLVVDHRADAFLDRRFGRTARDAPLDLDRYRAAL